TEAGRQDPINDTAQVDRLNAIIRRIATERPAVVLVDLGARVAGMPGADMDQALRPDGVHLSAAASRAMAEWYGPLIVAAVRSEPSADGGACHWRREPGPRRRDPFADG